MNYNRALGNTAAINDLAIKLKRDDINLRNAPDHPEVNHFLKMLHTYAQNLFLETLPVNDERREDAAQDACLRAVRSFDSFNPAQVEYTTYFYRICQSARSMQRRYHASLKRNPECGYVFSLNSKDDETQNWANNIPDRNALRPLDRLISREEAEKQRDNLELLYGDNSPLTKRQKQALDLRLQGNNQHQTAEIMECNNRNVSYLMKKVSEKARALIKPSWDR